MFAWGAAAGAIAQDSARYTCITTDFLTFSDEEDFVESNLRKTFVIQVSGEVIEVATQSDAYADTTHHYLIHLRDMLGTVAFRQDRPDDRLMLPDRPEDVFAREGSIPVTISLQAPTFANTWRLACEPA